jgi:hypothetical protein
LKDPDDDSDEEHDSSSDAFCTESSDKLSEFEEHDPEDGDQLHWIIKHAKDDAKGAIDRHAKVKDEVATVLGERTRHHDAGREGPRRAPGKEVAHI